jgi:hypothetical protein
MIHRRIKRVKDDYIVTIPKDEIERRGLHVGQLVGVLLLPVEVRTELPARLKQVLDEAFEEHAEGFQILFDEEAERLS